MILATEVQVVEQRTHGNQAVEKPINLPDNNLQELIVDDGQQNDSSTTKNNQHLKQQKKQQNNRAQKLGTIFLKSIFEIKTLIVDSHFLYEM